MVRNQQIFQFLCFWTQKDVTNDWSSYFIVSPFTTLYYHLMFIDPSLSNTVNFFKFIMPFISMAQRCPQQFTSSNVSDRWFKSYMCSLSLQFIFLIFLNLEIPNWFIPQPSLQSSISNVSA